MTNLNNTLTPLINNKRGLMDKKAQAWGFDVMIASIIFVAGITTFYFYAINQPGEAKGILEELSYEGSIIAENLLSEGFPENWNSDNVIKIGITTDNRINETKLGRFINLTNSSYDKTKSLFNIKFDYYVTISGSGLGEIGLPNSTDPDSLIKIDRLTIYQEKPVTLTVNIWD